jgi:hypothetical protein
MVALETSNPHHFEPPDPETRTVPGGANTVRRILVCVDESPFSEACLPYAVAISKSLGDPITLLHVMELPHEQSGQKTTEPIAWEISTPRHPAPVSPRQRRRSDR